jgi:glutamine synthetase
LVEAYLKQTGIADTAFFGPEAEFFIFDDVRFGSGTNDGFYELDSSEGRWNTGREEDRPQPRLQDPPQGRLLPGPAARHAQDLRTEMCSRWSAGHRDRDPPPRGRHRRPGRDRHAFDTLVRWPTSCASTSTW